MERYVELSPMEIQLGFVASCVEFVASALNKPYDEVYRQMKKIGMLRDYIFKHYEVLHAEGRERVTEELIDYMNKKQQE